MLSGICTELMAGIGHRIPALIFTNWTKLLLLYNNATRHRRDGI